ncbi:SPOR domain-containing protein [Wenxinia marina]|uniref:Cell division protein n=1 Tax=Wenxinia marina DSM 24838 TaxID=1123501 RepID=A0A0D0QGT9_9RHOB|nr:SPOR domain-containing protein [Wenxinia marina]KIQ70188.1 Cell division protein [Wenxinia marina DSM 24838]GGL50739.1 sporulation protein [Wenxinia marina]
MRGIPILGRSGLASGVALAALLALSACDEGFTLGGGDGADGAAPVTTSATELVERDVEAPEVFQVTEDGLWDGRPSLGGVWVAHPDVDEPERVIIRNEENGAFVIGALFRRERENIGPALQVSSDAADALQMLAGDPTRLNVTALRREEQAAPTPTDATAPEAVAAIDAPSEIEATPLDPIAGAAAAIDAAEADAAPLPAAQPAPAPQPAAAPAPAAASPLDRPYIQIGIFSVEANAQNTRSMMEADGIPARVISQESQGRAFWRVIVGPASSEGERATLLDRVKAAGFADAYFVRN